MQLSDDTTGYGLVSRVLHWGMAVAIFAMFGLGLWMVSLTYYSPYYRSAPDLHRSVGIMLAGLLVVRLVWRLANTRPDDTELSALERTASRAAHWGFYGLLALIVVSGYLISTPDGRAIDVFGLFSVPSLVQSKGLEEVAGRVHRWLAWATMGLALLHAAGALKHHVVDRNRILSRMWSGPAHDRTTQEKD